MQTPLKIIIVEDFIDARKGLESTLKESLSSTFSIEIVAKLSNADELMATIEKTKPDVLILDWDLGNGQTALAPLELIRKKYDNKLLKILIYTSYKTYALLSHCLEKKPNGVAKANGILYKNYTSEDVLFAIKKILANKLYLHEIYEEHYIDFLGKAYYMSATKEKILQYFAEGFNQIEIAEKLKTTPKYINNQIAELKNMVNATSTEQMLLKIKELGLLD